MVLFLIGIWRLTEEEAEWCWRWLRKKTRRQKEAEVIPDSHSYFGVFPIAIDVFALLQILEIGKRRMIVADPKVLVLNEAEKLSREAHLPVLDSSSARWRNLQTNAHTNEALCIAA
ncbi:hypothetical protein Bca52824_058696 [Brassica carinata]|uniref:Uncharacterized protein n=1 Tax=Brassica carinata TaxID=52824 RepID=A0A8X7UHH6_BRACI|nr:hypothetical protein Bca52824_058696 [Brassica carinata]